MDRFPAAVLDHPVQGAHLRGATLGAHLGERRTVIAFLRHFG